MRRSRLGIAAGMMITMACVGAIALAQTGGKTRSAVVTAPPATVRKKLKLSPFYKKYLSAGGLPVVASGKVPDAALQEAVRIVNAMLADREDVRRAIIKNRVRVAVMASSELTTDLPEHSDLTPKAYWDKRARGLGATPWRPAISCAEENLLHLPEDRYNGENILVHEFAHTIHEMGLNSIDKTFEPKLKKAYKAAISKGLWRDTYAATDYKEYWAEGVQSYFDTNLAIADTRDKLATYDPALFKLIDTTLRQSKWRYTP